MNSEQNAPAHANSPSSEPLSAEALAQVAVAALEDMKGVDIRLLDVRGQCNFADFMVFSSGTSDRHLKSQANNVVEAVKARGVRPMGVEGDQTPNTEWVLVDLVDVVVHIMLPETRDHYQLEKLWSAHSSSGAKVAAAGSSAYASALEKIRGGDAVADETDAERARVFLETDWDADIDDDAWEDSDFADDDGDDVVDTDTPHRV